MGKVGFGELAFWLATPAPPEPGEVRVFEAVLVALADHGFTPTAIVARLTYLSAPDSIQGALAAGLLGGGLAVPRGHRGHRPVPARRAAAADGPSCPTDDAGWDALALRDRHGAAGGRAVRPRPRATPSTRTATRARPG